VISFPCCKINLGLHVTAKRADGFHDLETAFYPVNWNDALEAVSHPEGKGFELRCSGPVSPGPGKNIITKAWELVKARTAVPPLMVCLYKNIPAGAGLGGGSADAAFFLKMLRDHFSVHLGDRELFDLALELGSDCPFFLENKPVLASGRGEVFRPLDLSLDSYFIAVVHPGVHISTAEAFGMISPTAPDKAISDILKTDPSQWRHALRNDFEAVAIRKHPELAKLKQQLYDAGAVYASMSGSGSSFYGVFRNNPVLDLPAGYRIFVQRPASEIL
jgi:4-diphosphocytidyl-2-C-methyl-D-erythritol kinase